MEKLHGRPPKKVFVSLSELSEWIQLHWQFSDIFVALLNGSQEEVPTAHRWQLNGGANIKLVLALSAPSVVRKVN